MHGLSIEESTKGPRPVKPASLAVIGLVATAAATDVAAIAALDAAFPINAPVLVSDINAAIESAGSTGTLAPALEAIADQATPLVVVVRVAEEADAEQTEANVIAGIEALMTAQSAVGLRPRILGAPGLDTQAVTTELVVAAKRLRGRVYARAGGEDLSTVLAYRRSFAARELTLIWPDTVGTAAQASVFAGDAVARALGLRARIDEEQGWHKTLSNVPFDGANGLTRHVHFDLLDPSTEAGLLNDGGIVTIIRQNGFRFWGNRTCAGDDQPEYAFESAVRTLHALQDELETIVAPFMDQPMTVALIKDLKETANARYAQLTREGRIMGGEVFFDEDQNPPEELAAGRPRFRIQFTPVAPLENPRVQLVITDFYYAGFADQVA